MADENGMKYAKMDSDEHEVEVATTVIGLESRKSGALGEERHSGCGALHRVARDGVPHCNKCAAAAGGGDLVTEEGPHSVNPRENANATYCCDESCV